MFYLQGKNHVFFEADTLEKVQAEVFCLAADALAEGFISQEQHDSVMCARVGDSYKFGDQCFTVCSDEEKHAQAVRKYWQEANQAPLFYR